MEEKSIWQKLVEDKSNIVLLSVYTVLLLFFCSKMSPLYPMNEWSDANIYFNVGKCIFNGKTLYAEAFDHKGPLIFFIYGFGYLISNTSFFGVFIFQVLVWLLLLWATYLTSSLFLKKEYALLVALIFPLIILRYTGAGGAPEEFILAFEAISLYLFILYFNGRTPEHPPIYMFWHGVLFSMTLLIKMNLVAFWIFPLMGIFLNVLFSKSFKNLGINFVAFVGGVLLIALPIGLYFYLNNAVDDAFDTYVVLNRMYGSIISIGDAIVHLLMRAYLLMRTDLVNFLLALLGLVYFPIRYVKNRIGKIAMILCGISVYASIYATAAYHFYYPLPFAAFSMLGLIALFAYFSNYISFYYSRKLLFSIAFIAFLVGVNQKTFFDTGGEILLRKNSPDDVAHQFANIVKQENNPSFANLGVGQCNAIFTICDIVPNVKYFITPNISHSMYPDMRNQQTSYIEKAELDFLVLTNFSMNYNYFSTLPALQENYTLVDTWVDKTNFVDDSFFTSYLYKKK